jgi:hypothetical protein
MQGVNKEMSFWLTNSALVYESKSGEEGGVAESQPMSTAVHRSPNKGLRSNSIFNLCSHVYPPFPAFIRKKSPTHTEPDVENLGVFPSRLYTVKKD